ncbi:MAG TPA: hypothetical protein VMR59_03885 [Patescibacteria group bacterium]|nr:hypothetical protein [Patescibacteria group bacterium]
MQTFSKRNNLKKEYSGYGEASKNLRNRLLLLYGHPYSGNEFQFGLGNDNWIHEVAFSKDLQMHYGRKIPIEDFRDETKTTYDEVFDFIELYYKRALQDLNYQKKNELLRDICLAFINSGSVYEFNQDAQVNLSIDETVAEQITKTDSVLEPFNNAQAVYRDCIDGLITRSKAPKDVVGDIYIVLEEYSKQITQQDTFEKAIEYFRTKLAFHPTQIQLIEKLKAYRGDVWGVAHAGKGLMPDEPEALWYTESVIAQINYIDNKIKQTVIS